MTDTPFIKALTDAWSSMPSWSSMPPAAWPLATVRTYWVDLPVEVATRMQKFSAAQMEEQMKLLTSLSHAEGASSIVLREAAFLQQAAVAWGGEWLEIVELYQERLLNPVQGVEAGDPPVVFPKAA